MYAQLSKAAWIKYVHAIASDITIAPIYWLYIYIGGDITSMRIDPYICYKRLCVVSSLKDNNCNALSPERRIVSFPFQ